MRIDDGKLIRIALLNKPIEIYSDSNQTRSFCYVDDLIQGMINL